MDVIECPSGTFGLDCSSQCHCQENDKCSNVNGLCSTGVCGYGWGGASCQRGIVLCFTYLLHKRVYRTDWPYIVVYLNPTSILIIHNLEAIKNAVKRKFWRK